MDRARKRELRRLNSSVWDGEDNVFETAKSLDSSLKKNTAFIKRLRTAITASTLPTFLQEIRTLSLHKYLSEIVSACFEGLCKLKSPGEIEAGVEIVCALHQRFGPLEFTQLLGWLVGKGMATPDKAILKTLPADAKEKEEKDRITRQRVLLRVVTELWLVGVLRTLDDVTRPDDTARGKESLVGTPVKSTEQKIKVSGSTKGGGAEPFPLEVLKDLLGHDREHANLPLLVTFVKLFGYDILGIKDTTAEGRKTVQEDGTIQVGVDDALDRPESDGEAQIDAPVIDEAPLASTELQQRFQNILKRYFEDVKTHLVRDQKALVQQAKRNAEAYVKSGEVFEDRQANYEKQIKAVEKLSSNAQILAESLGLDMPDMHDTNDPLTDANGGIGLVKTGEFLRGQGEGAGIWEDEDERRFYENLVDLKGKVPGMLLEDATKKKKDAGEQVGKRNDAPDAVSEAELKVADNDDQSTAIANKSVGAQVDALLARLPELTNKELIDQAAIDFCFLNSKASRNRLIKAVQEVPRGRSDLLPSWSRLIATLGRHMPDVVKGLVEYLDAEFRSLQRRKEKDFLGQVRLSNIRYLAELTKFGVVPEHVIFHCLKVSLDEFSRMNIEIICNLLENCGRYLLRNPETAPRMTAFLETLQRKKGHTGQQERMLIENAVYYVDPPERAAIPQKERTPMDSFIRKLIYLDMNKRNYPKILKQIRRLHWEEKEVTNTLRKILSKPGKVKYGSIHLLALIIGALSRYHQEFVVDVIDTVIESISTGLEQNDFKFNQRRIAEVKYLGELYNYRMVDHPVVFDVMYRILTFGHGGIPHPGRVSPFDMPDDFFRIRLIASILDTCGTYYNRGPAGKKLDYFLSFFQYYICTKDPLPMDIEFIVQDVFTLTRPQWKLTSNIEEASRAFQLAMAQDQKTSGVERSVETEELEVDDSSSDDAALPDEEAEDSSAEDEEIEVVANGDDMPSTDVSDVEQDDQEDEEAIVVTRQAEEVDLADAEDFDREYAKMMAESLDARKFERKQVFDLPLPLRRKERDLGTTMDSGAGDTLTAELPPPTPVANGTMAFSLLTKRGNRQQTRTVELPSDSTFAVAMKTQQQAEREEQQKIKNLVLNYDLRDEDADDTGYDPKLIAINARTDKSGNNRSGQRARKLQLSDVDWYARDSNKIAHTHNSIIEARYPAGCQGLVLGRGADRNTRSAQSQDHPPSPTLANPEPSITKPQTLTRILRICPPALGSDTNEVQIGLGRSKV